jgi:peptide deformylase
MPKFNFLMKYYTLLLFFIVVSVSLTKCTPMNSALTLDIPTTGIHILQQIPSGDAARASSPLYLPPRRIEEKEFNTPQLQLLLDSMYATMVRTAGVGIAANQIGKQLQICMIEAKSDNPRYKVLGPVEKQIFINPRITKASDQRRNFWHGCLSAAGEKRGNVATYEWIEYECQDPKGNIQKARLDGFAAVIFQHELKHLMSGTYLDVANEYLAKPELDHQIEIGRVAFFGLANDTLPLLIGGYQVGETLDEYHARQKSASASK